MNRLGGAGLAALERHRDSERNFASLSSTLSQAQVDSLRAQLTQFRSALAHFASTHREKIRRDPAFRHAFSQMCASIGVDPLAGGGPGRRGGGGAGGGGAGFVGAGGWWAELLGLGDWNLELGVQIVDVCVSTRERNGGLIEMAELLRLLGKLRGTTTTSSTTTTTSGETAAGGVTEEDVVRSIRSLRPLGAGYEVLAVGGRRMVRSVPRELDKDQATVLAAARAGGGRVTEAGLAAHAGWTRERARAALENMLLRDGLCWLDEQDAECGRAYWVVSVMQWDE